MPKSTMAERIWATAGGLAFTVCSFTYLLVGGRGWLAGALWSLWLVLMVAMGLAER